MNYIKYECGCSFKVTGDFKKGISLIIGAMCEDHENEVQDALTQSTNE